MANKPKPKSKAKAKRKTKVKKTKKGKAPMTTQDPGPPTPDDDGQLSLGNPHEAPGGVESEEPETVSQADVVDSGVPSEDEKAAANKFRNEPGVSAAKKESDDDDDDSPKSLKPPNDVTMNRRMARGLHPWERCKTCNKLTTSASSTGSEKQGEMIYTTRRRWCWNCKAWYKHVEMNRYAPL